MTQACVNVLITGGVHGYKTSGVQGALLFLQTKAEQYTTHHHNHNNNKQQPQQQPPPRINWVVILGFVEWGPFDAIVRQLLDSSGRSERRQLAASLAQTGYNG
ncbi:hypothetical protein ACA910_018192 [Epithemia clementina (nom. ined.)]